MTEIITIESESAWEELSNGIKIEPKEIGFKITLQDFVDTTLTLEYVQGVIEELFKLGEVNPNSKVYLKYKDIVNKMMFDGHCSEIWADDILSIDRDELKGELNCELSKLSETKKIILLNRVPWESMVNTNISFYRRMAFNPVSKDIDITFKEKDNG